MILIYCKCSQANKPEYVCKYVFSGAFPILALGAAELPEVPSRAAFNAPLHDKRLNNSCNNSCRKTVIITDQQRQSVPVSFLDSVKNSIPAKCLTISPKSSESAANSLYLFSFAVCRFATPVVTSTTFPCCTLCPPVLSGHEHDIFPEDPPHTQPSGCPRDQSLRWGCWISQCEVGSCGSSCSYYGSSTMFI